MNKKIIILIIITITLIVGAIYFISAGDEPTENPTVQNGIGNSENPKEELEISDEFIQCLKDKGVVIYGSSTCPACARLKQEYGGYDKVKSIYLDCSGLGSQEEAERCMEDMQTSYIPEVQIKGELFEGWGSPEALSEITGCH